MSLSKRLPSDFQYKLRNIRAFVMDVDGVLTDGHLWFGAQGELMKGFHVLDGQGIVTLKAAGILTGIITGRASEIVNQRATDLKIDAVVQGSRDKAEDLRKMIASWNISLEETLYIGDDVPDICALEIVGCAVTVPDAHNSVRNIVDWTTHQSGGLGAVREVCDLILTYSQHVKENPHSFLKARKNTEQTIPGDNA
ncbi:MAG: HAD-IIIA family hydrolase [Pseudomonadota bacterium]